MRGECVMADMSIYRQYLSGDGAALEAVFVAIYIRRPEIMLSCF